MCDQGRSKIKKRMKRSQLEFSAAPTFQSHFCIFCSLFESKGQQGWYTGHCVLPGRSCHHFCGDIFPVALLLLTSKHSWEGEAQKANINIYRLLQVQDETYQTVNLSLLIVSRGSGPWQVFILYMPAHTFIILSTHLSRRFAQMHLLRTSP